MFTIIQSRRRVFIMILQHPPMRRVAQQRLFDQQDAVVNDGLKRQRRPSGDDREEPRVFQTPRGINEKLRLPSHTDQTSRC
jgi:hypothetical protein